MVAIPKKFALNAEKKLSPREQQIIVRLAAGETWKCVAVGLGISIRTVQAHVVNIRRKLGVENTPAAVLELSR
jgi:DNA-binding CsgD family transcriptional regulator